MRHNDSVYLILVVVLLSVIAGCGDGEQILRIDATGAIAATLVVDADGDGSPSASDRTVADARVYLYDRGVEPVATAVTDSNGVAIFEDVPVATYRLDVDRSLTGDTLALDPELASVSPTPAGTLETIALLEFPVRTVAQVRASTVGPAAVVVGRALHQPGLFGDSLLHIEDDTGALRVTRVPLVSVAAGDSVRLVGRIAEVDGQTVLTSPVITRAGEAAELEPAIVATSAAATADSGLRDAALVTVKHASVIGTDATGADPIVVVDDGSGRVNVVLDRSARITTDGSLAPGAFVDVTGVLVPSTGGRWVLKPRSNADLSIDIPTSSIAEVRNAEVRRAVAIEGVALNGSDDFTESTIHFADPTGAIATFGIGSTLVVPGDSLRIVGTVAIRNGQPTLSVLSATARGTGTLPDPVQLGTSEASSARSGAMDAALVRIGPASVDSVATAGADSELLVNDGSGRLTILIDRNLGVDAKTFAGRTDFSAVGLLVSRGTTWVLKPRTEADLE